MTHPPSSAAKTLTVEQIETAYKEICAHYGRDEIVGLRQICDMALASITQPAAVEADEAEITRIVAAVQPLICPTWSMRGETMEGRISEKDFWILVNLARKQ